MYEYLVRSLYIRALKRTSNRKKRVILTEDRNTFPHIEELALNLSGYELKKQRLSKDYMYGYCGTGYSYEDPCHPALLIVTPEAV